VAYELLRQQIPFLAHDAVLSPYMEAARQLVASGAIKEAVETTLALA